MFVEALTFAEQRTVAGMTWPVLPSPSRGCPGESGSFSGVLAELVEHANPSGRRIGIHACPRAKQFQAAGLREALLRRLADPDPWVRYDAAWTVREAGYDGLDIREALGVLAAGVTLSDDLQRLKADSHNAVLAARVRAKEALDALPPPLVRSA